MSAQTIQFNPEVSNFSIKDLDTLIMALEVRVRAREVMHRKEAAEYLGINIRTLDRLATAGVIPYHKLEGLEGTRFYLRSELLTKIKES